MPEPAKARVPQDTEIKSWKQYRQKHEKSQSVYNISEEKSNDPSSFTREQSPADIVHVHSVSPSAPESFIGRNWLKLVKLDWTKQAKINRVTSQTNLPIWKWLENLLQENQKLFKDELGH